MAERARLRVATGNIHMGKGSDGRRKLERVARVIRGLEVDCIGLQEVDNRYAVVADIELEG